MELYNAVGNKGEPGNHKRRKEVSAPTHQLKGEVITLGGRVGGGLFVGDLMGGGACPSTRCQPGKEINAPWRGSLKKGERGGISGHEEGRGGKKSPSGVDHFQNAYGLSSRLGEPFLFRLTFQLIALYPEGVFTNCYLLKEMEAQGRGCRARRGQ